MITLKYLLGMYEGSDLGASDQLVGVYMQVTVGSYTLDQSLHTKDFVMEEMGSMNIGRVYTPLDPVIQLLARWDRRKEVEVSRLAYAEIVVNPTATSRG